MPRSVLALLALSLCAITAVGQDPIQLDLFLPTVRVRPEGPLPAAMAEAEIQSARNEYESIQLVISATREPLNDVHVEITPFTKADGTALPAECVTLYAEAFVPIRYVSPRATEAPGLIPDPLIPFVDPYTGETVAAPRWDGELLEGDRRFGAAPFEIWPGHHQPIWIDLFVPKDAAPGSYTATAVVNAKGVAPITVPLSLTVWDFTLPDGPTHENHLGHLGYGDYYKDKADDETRALIEERYGAMLAANRINPDMPRSLWPATQEDGSLVMDASADATMSAFVQQYHVTNIQIPVAPIADAMGANRDKARRYYQTVYAYLDSKGWADRSYLYMFDEPNDADAYARVREMGDFIHEAEPRIRCLVVEQTYTQDPTWTDIDPAVDIWCPLFSFIDGDSVAEKQRGGDDVWSYTALIQTAHPYHPQYESVKDDLPPFWEIDHPVTAYRIAPWLNRRYGITGLLYWGAAYWGSPDRNPWYDPGFRVRWNGEGSFLYPGDEAGIEGPVGSIRLKNLRDGMEDYEYFVLLERLGGKAAVEDIVREAVPTWGTWQQDPSALPTLRRRIAAEITTRGK